MHKGHQAFVGAHFHGTDDVQVGTNSAAVIVEGGVLVKKQLHVRNLTFDDNTLVLESDQTLQPYDPHFLIVEAKADVVLNLPTASSSWEMPRAYHITKRNFDFTVTVQPDNGDSVELREADDTVKYIYLPGRDRWYVT